MKSPKLPPKVSKADLKKMSPRKAMATNNKSNDVIGCIMPLRISEQFAPLSKNNALLKLNATDCENLNFGERPKDTSPGISQDQHAAYSPRVIFTKR